MMNYYAATDRCFQRTLKDKGKGSEYNINEIQNIRYNFMLDNTNYWEKGRE